MKEAIRPLDLVIPEQFFDATRRRVSIVLRRRHRRPRRHGRSGVPDAGRRAREGRARRHGATVHRGGTYICIEGPQFSTKAESRIYRSWGVDVIGMTNMPEAKLAREAELCYATLALVTDYDVWHESHETVTVEAVIQQPPAQRGDGQGGPAPGDPRDRADRARAAAPSLLRNAVITQPAAFPHRHPSPARSAARQVLPRRSGRTGTAQEARVADLLVVGSVALDSVETPFGKVQEVLGGSATFFSYSASFFTPVPPGGDGRRGFPRGAPEAARRDRGVDVRRAPASPPAARSGGRARTATT